MMIKFHKTYLIFYGLAVLLNANYSTTSESDDFAQGSGAVAVTDEISVTTEMPVGAAQEKEDTQSMVEAAPSPESIAQDEQLLLSSPEETSSIAPSSSSSSTSTDQPGDTTMTTAMELSKRNATVDDSNVVTSLRLDAGAAVSPIPPLLEVEPEKVQEEGTTPKEPDMDLPTIGRISNDIETTPIPSTSTLKISTTLGAIIVEKSTSTAKPPETTTATTQKPSSTAFLSFLDPNFEKKYVPQSTKQLAEAKPSVEPLRCYICSNNNRSCDVSAVLSSKAHRDDTGNLIRYDTQAVGVSLIECPPDATSCAKLSITVRTIQASETIFERTTTRFCSNVEKSRCETKYGADTEYEQCYCRSHACNAGYVSRNAFISASLVSLLFVTATILANM